MDYITRCPACTIAFQVSDEQLQLAGGKVRCGACLSIFDARSHFELPLAEQPVSTPDLDDEVLIHDQMDASLVEQIEQQPPSYTEPEQQLEPDTPKAPLTLPPAVQHPRLTHEPSEDLPAEEAESVIAMGCDSDGSIIELSCDSEDDEELADGEPTEPEAAEETLFEAPDPADDFPFGTRPAKPKRNPLWAIACVLLITLLPLQYLHFHAAELGQQWLQYRPWIDKLCAITGCQIPPQVDLAKIKPSYLMVSNHPSSANALLVEAVIENQADFAQPMPRLLLSFSNLSGETIAQRSFHPSEYLQGEMSGKNQLPPKRPVRVRIELADPGPDATNYEMLVVRNNEQ
ncbi:DUF3426 domain-containing protein [bacterium SCSIO 12696]|nr:DUF3426 domain-containing protein [bacterium SCSIO 12696]